MAIGKRIDTESIVQGFRGELLTFVALVRPTPAPVGAVANPDRPRTWRRVPAAGDLRTRWAEVAIDRARVSPVRFITVPR